MAVVVLAVVSVPIVLTAVFVAGSLVWLAVFVASLLVTFLSPESGALLKAVVSNWVVIVVLAGAALLPVTYLGPVRAEIAAFRSELRAAGTPVAQRDPELAGMVQRLAQQAEITVPDVYVTNRDSPASYALGGRSDGTIVLTRGLVRTLSEEELTAVVAHEISHLRNGDSRIMGVALVPMLLADHVGSEQGPDSSWIVRQPLVYAGWTVAWAVLTVLTTLQRVCGQAGVALLSRGRERAADRGAAELTGSPGSLASALRTLTGARTRPSEDLRTFQQSASVLDILPTDRSKSAGLVQTHPDTETRIEYLEEMAVEIEQ